MLLGDFVSVYLALLYGVDPTPVEKIDHLVQPLAKTFVPYAKRFVGRSDHRGGGGQTRTRGRQVLPGLADLEAYALFKTLHVGLERTGAVPGDGPRSAVGATAEDVDLRHTEDGGRIVMRSENTVVIPVQPTDHRHLGKAVARELVGLAGVRE